MDPNSDRCYLLLLKLAFNDAEHTQIPDALRQASDGRYKPVYSDKQRGGAFLLQSRYRADEIAGHFGKILMNDDQYLIIEVGPDWWVSRNQSAAQGWLHTHVPRKR